MKFLLLSLIALLAESGISPTLAGGRGDILGPDGLRAAVAAVEAEVIALRRDLHSHPELGEREVRTAGVVAEHLRGLGLEVRVGLAHTGVAALLEGGLDGPLVAYRADIDALPVTERTGLSFASTRTDMWDGEEVGLMHACGHDLHTAVGLGVATILAEPAVRARLRGSVLFVFQPAEEGHPDPGSHGAELMLEEGLFSERRPGAIFAMHVTPALATGEVAVVEGGAMAAVDRFSIEVIGRQTHGAYPQNGIDPIVVASQIVLGLQTVASRTVDTRDAVVVSVGKIEAGNRFNIIPERASLLGTIRTHDEAVQERVHESVTRIAKRIAEAFGASAEVEIDKVCPVTFNDPELVRRMRPTIAGAARLVEEKPHMGGEDFAFFAREVPGLYYFLGVSDLSKGTPAMIHTPFFSPEESSIPVALRVSTALLLGWLEAETGGK